MKFNILLVMATVLASAMVVPIGSSYAANFTASSASVQTINGQPLTNQTMPMMNSTGMNQTGMPMTNSSAASKTNMPLMNYGMNHTMTSNTASVPNATDTKAAQKISDFIHQAVTDFNQQGIETKQAIADCRDKLQSANPDQISGVRNGYCTTNLSIIKLKYQNERAQYADLIKNYRQSVMVIINDAHGLPVSKSTLGDALTQLGMMMHSSSGMMGRAATLNNTNCVNPSGIPTGRC
ncbi:MAG: hypothetical protein KGH76_01130, partial [Thaumarchaeota archaeon]|nr:hypothetical protein [Nitrososphaerota archaeon]